MKISCQACGAKYTISDNKVRGKRVKIRCKSCGTPIVVESDATESGSGKSVAAEPVAASAAAANPTSDTWSVNLSDTDQRTMTVDELVAGWRTGTVTSDAYVWKEGMGDWVAILDVPELRGALQGALASEPAAPEPAAPEPARVSFPTARAAVRGPGARSAGMDLFGGVALAGSETDVTTGAIAGSTPYVDDKPAGARNENSVLFSLDALKAGVGSTPEKSAPKRPEPSRPTPKSDDPFGMANGSSDLMGIGGGGLFLDNQALLSAPTPAEPPPKSLASSSLAGALLAPAAPAGKKNNKLVLAIGSAVAVLAIIGIVIATSGGEDEPTAAKKEDSTALASEKPSEKPAQEAPKAEAPKPEPAVPPASASAAAAEPEPKPEPEAEKPAAEPEKPAQPASKESLAAAIKPKAESKPKETAPAATGPFNKGAAIAALGAAAGSASRCKKPGGPTGSGRAIVTFAPSGRVTSANITGGSFGGSSVGGCVASIFRRAKVPPFSGNAVTVSKSFTIN